MSQAALTDGLWVTRGLIQVWVPADPTWSPEDSDSELWDRIATNLRRDGFVDMTPVTGDVCDHCGCLLAPDEDCPGCLVAMRSEEVAA